MWYFQEIAFAAGLLLVSAWGPALGGFAYALFTAPMRLPGLGPIYAFVVDGPIKVVYPAKACAWLISGFSPAMLIVGFETLSDWPLHSPLFSWIMLTVGATTACNEMARVILFRTPDYYLIKTLPEALQRLVTQGATITEAMQKRLARSQFVDMTLVGLLKILCAAAIIAYSLQHLGLLAAQRNLSLPEMIFHTASLLTLLGEPSGPLTGPAAYWFSGAVKFTAFVYFTFFISLASTLIDDSHAEV
jgi:hypothetical protein